MYLDVYESVDNDDDNNNNDDTSNSKTKVTGLINLKDDKLLKGDVPLLSLAVKLEYYGANLSNTLNDDVSHIIIDPDDTKRVNHIKHRLASMNIYIPYALTPAWVNRCIDSNDLVTPTEAEKYYWKSAKHFS